MLDDLVPMRWHATQDGFAGVPLGPLPESFALLAPDFADDNAIAPHGLDGAMMTMRLPWVQTGGGPIVLAAPLRYDWTRGEFHVSRRDIATAKRCLADAAKGTFAPLEAQSAGCIGQMTERPLSERFANAAGLDAASLVRDETGLVFSAPLGAGQGGFSENGLPDALAFHSDALPDRISLTIEATTACNFRCGFCYGRHMKQGVLRRPQFEALLDNTPELAAVEFTGEGEPLMNKDTPAMIAACKARGVWVHVTSNGSNMTTERAAMLLDLDIDSFSVSTEATDPETFRRMRPGGELADLTSAIALMRAEIRRRGAGPDLRLWVSLMRADLNRIDDFFAFGDAHGFDHVEFQTLNTLPSYRRFYPDFLKDEAADWAALDAASRQPGVSPRGRAALVELAGMFSGVTCHRFAHVLAPTFQGQLSPCCMLKVPDFPSVGDMTTTPLREIWQEPRFRRFRFALHHGVILQSCDGCTNVAAACRSDPGENHDLIEQPAHLGAIA
jgi:MoaA/NifB/PqqE/SkfB family radical SAM enzyme